MGADDAIDLEPKDALLLAYIAVEGPTPRGRLAMLLWPDVDEERARGNLRQRLLRLKRTTGVELVVGNPQAALAPGIGHDLDDAHELLHGIDPQQAGGLADWLDAQRDRRRRKRIDWLDAATTQAETEGDLAAALEHANALVALDPLSEHAHRRVMKLHYLRGDTAAATTAYERCRQTLKRELNAAPSKDTEALRASVAGAVAPASGINPARTVPLSVLRPPRLVGRDHEWAALSEVWQTRQSAVVVGEPGMGKTRLLTDLATAHGNAVVVTARPGDLRVPHALLSRLVRLLLQRAVEPLEPGVRKELARLLPELGEAEPLKSDSDRARFINAVQALLHQATACGAHGIIVDDLHYADNASVETLQQLAGAEEGLAWVIAHRPGELPAESGALIDELAHARRSTHCRLPPLTTTEVAELIDSLGVAPLRGTALAPQIAQHTGGNPLFVLETLKALLTQGTRNAGQRTLPVTANVTALIERRIGQLSPEAIRLARCAAIAGQEFSADLAARVLETNALDLADAWNELERAQVFRDGAFVHDLIYEAALASVPDAIARHLHGKVGNLLQDLGAPPARAAFHLDAAGMDVEAAALWVAAGDADAAGLRYIEAATAYERAAELYGSCALCAEGFQAALKMRKVCYEVDLRDRSERALQLLDQLAHTPVERAWADSERATTCLMRGDLPGTEKHAQAGLRQLGGADQPLLRAELRRSLAAVLTWKGESALALNELRSIQFDIERLCTPTQRFDFVQSLAIVLDHNDQTDEAIERNREAIELGLAIGNVAGAAQCALNLVVSQHDIGDLRAAQQSLARARSLLESLPDTERSYSSFELNSGLVERGLGDYAQALMHFDRAIERAREQTPGWLPLMVAHHAQTLLYLGQSARAQHELDAHAPDAATPLLALARWRSARAELDWQLGKAAGGELDALIAAQPARGRLLSRWRLQAVRLALPGDARAQLKEAEEMLPALAAAGRIGLLICVHTRAAQLAKKIGEATVAAEHARRALALLRTREPDSLYPGEVWLAAFHALREAAPDEAAQALANGVTWVRDTAQKRVPEQFRDSFLHRNPVNRELLTSATRGVRA
jgi:DNA-binding SARP family transcriptional activator/tetratricopeptide (TPR) repeat protein